MEIFEKPGTPIIRDPRDRRISSLLVEGEKKAKIGIMGIPWDWSVTGRPGARLAPGKIRNYLYSLTTFSPVKGDLECKIIDAGNVKVAPGDWELTMSRTIQAVSYLLEKTEKLLIIGGDHSVTRPVLEALVKRGSIGIVFLDTHYDLRNLYEGMSSGTWLWDLYSRYKDKLKATVIGIDEYSNPPYLGERSRETGMNVVTLRSIMDEGLEPGFEAIRQMRDENLDYYYVSVDMDHIDMAFAPGVNAPAAMGLTPRESLKLIEFMIRTLDPIGIDFTEVNPLTDVNDATSRLTARLAATALHELCSR